MIVTGWKSVRKEIIEKNALIWGFFRINSTPYYAALFMMNNTRVLFTIIFFDAKTRKIRVKVFKEVRLGLEFLLWYNVRILEEDIFCIIIDVCNVSNI